MQTKMETTQIIKSTQEIVRHQQQSAWLTNSKTLSAEAKKVLKIKYAAKPFAQLSEIEQEAHSIALLIKIHVVTGWPVPDDDAQQNILAEQLKLYLIENWPLYNVDEIMYSMRSYATVVNNWGKNMNLSLIGKAIADYEKERSDISALEESKAMKPQETNLLTMEADWKQLCEGYYQDYLNNKFTFSIMPYELYGEFVKCGMMSDDAFEGWMNEAKATLIYQLKFELAETSKESEKEELKEKIRSIQNGENETKIVQQAKKLAVQFLYKEAKKKGFKQLFEKDKT